MTVNPALAIRGEVHETANRPQVFIRWETQRHRAVSTEPSPATIATTRCPTRPRSTKPRPCSLGNSTSRRLQGSAAPTFLERPRLPRLLLPIEVAEEALVTAARDADDPADRPEAHASQEEADEILPLLGDQPLPGLGDEATAASPAEGLGGVGAERPVADDLGLAAARAARRRVGGRHLHPSPNDTGNPRHRAANREDMRARPVHRLGTFH